MLGTKQEEGGKIYFLNVKDGKILHRDGLVASQFDFVEGYLEKIFQKERTFNGETLIYWYINLRDTKGGDLYSLGLPYNSGVFKSIILSLAGDTELTALSKIRIETYYKDGHTKVAVYDGKTKLDWISKELPPIDLKEVGGKTIKDDTKRMEYIAGLVQKVTEKL